MLCVAVSVFVRVTPMLLTSKFCSFTTFALVSTFPPKTQPRNYIISSVNRMAAGSRLQVQVMDFFFFHFLFKHALCSQV